MQSLIDSKPSSCVIRCCQVASIALSGGLALSLLLSPAADAKNLADQRREQEEQILAQEKKLEYLIQLQENARKAELLAK